MSSKAEKKRNPRVRIKAYAGGKVVLDTVVKAYNRPAPKGKTRGGKKNRSRRKAS
jgi:hypothetical protein